MPTVGLRHWSHTYRSHVNQSLKRKPLVARLLSSPWDVRSERNVPLASKGGKQRLLQMQCVGGRSNSFAGLSHPPPALWLLLRCHFQGRACNLFQTFHCWHRCARQAGAEKSAALRKALCVEGGGFLCPPACCAKAAGQKHGPRINAPPVLSKNSLCTAPVVSARRPLPLSGAGQPRPQTGKKVKRVSHALVVPLITVLY